MHWDLEPSILIGIALLTGGYALATGPLRERLGASQPVPPAQRAAFYLGMLCVFAALVSPLDELADTDLFSAHMAQHMLLTFIAPPLWLTGTPDWLIRRFVPRRFLAVIANPFAAFIIFNGVMWLWHLPGAYDAALESLPLHIAEHLMFMASAVIGWWPVLGPGLASRPAMRLAYLVPSLFSCTALAALITLSPAPLYSYYGDAALAWGLMPLADQQIGGAIMWMPGDLLYLGLILWTVKALIDTAGTEQQAAG